VSASRGTKPRATSSRNGGRHHSGIGGGLVPESAVRVVRGDWTRPAEDLALINMRKAKQTNRRMLERVYNPSVVAVGMFNVLKAPDWAKGGGGA
jgi:hypothetical protein